MTPKRIIMMPKREIKDGSRNAKLTSCKILNRKRPERIKGSMARLVLYSPDFETLHESN
jgi:hypothetical protein